jgi:hypothetical protein
VPDLLENIAMKKKLLEYLLVFILLSPLLFINIRNSHDWGDDFAGYLREAKNIAEGKPFYQSKFQFHDYNLSYSPPYYSYGFPLLLSPIVKIWGLNYKVLNLYMSLWLVAWALLTFAYLRRFFSLFACVSITLIFFLDPFYFDFKTYIISDIPFSFFFLLSLILYQSRGSRSVYYLAVTGLAMAFATGIRSIGMLLLIVAAADIALSFIKYMLQKISSAEFKPAAANNLIILFSAAVFICIFDRLIFIAPAGLHAHFIQLFRSHQYWPLVLSNLDNYTTQYVALFHHDAGRYAFANQYASAFMLTLLVIGLLLNIRRAEALLAIAYGIIILLFPFATQGFRYLLPLVPVFMYCVIIGAKSIHIRSSYYRSFLAVCFVLFMLLIYCKEIKVMRRDENAVLRPSPFTEESQAALTYIRTSTPDTAVIACLKPKAIELMTGHSTCVLPAGDDLATVAAKLNIAHPGYLLSIRDLGARVDGVAAIRKDSLVWENSAYRLYICNKH